MICSLGESTASDKLYVYLEVIELALRIKAVHKGCRRLICHLLIVHIMYPYRRVIEHRTCTNVIFVPPRLLVFWNDTLLYAQFGMIDIFTGYSNGILNCILFLNNNEGLQCLLSPFHSRNTFTINFFYSMIQYKSVAAIWRSISYLRPSSARVRNTPSVLPSQPIPKLS